MDVLLTPEAAEMIETLLVEHDLPDEGGLRLCAASCGAATSLNMRVCEAPEPADHVVAAHGGRLFLDDYARDRLRDMSLERSRTGQVDVFLLRGADEHRGGLPSAGRLLPVLGAAARRLAQLPRAGGPDSTGTDGPGAGQP